MKCLFCDYWRGTSAFEHKFGKELLEFRQCGNALKTLKSRVEANDGCEWGRPKKKEKK